MIPVTLSFANQSETDIQVYIETANSFNMSSV